jgi:transcriptional regulator with XRE-family HTH domain
MASLYPSFGRTVKALRKATGLSQEDFADAIDVHRTHMGTIESGRANPTLETIASIARGLELSLTQLFEAVERDQAGTPDITPQPSTRAQRARGSKRRRLGGKG